jgi:hypothetical protein
MPTDGKEAEVRESSESSEQGDDAFSGLVKEIAVLGQSALRPPEQACLPRPTDEPPAAEKPPMGAPMQAVVRGGTHTMRSERLYHERFTDAERRRDQAESYQRLASIPVEQGGARMYSHNFSDHPDVPKAYLLIRYANRYGAPVSPGECLADIVVENWEKPNDLSLIFVCPGCYTDHHKSAGDCQIKMRMSNRWWALSPKPGKIRWVEADGTVRIYHSAGIITESEPFSCPDCHYRGRFANGWLREE